MTVNPFFSGRIPPDLNKRVEEHCQETGEKKTEVLIKALSAYVNFPIKTANLISQQSELTEEIFAKFTNLEERVRTLEELARNNENFVIKPDNKDNTQTNLPDNYTELNGNKIDNKEEEIIIGDNNTDKQEFKIREKVESGLPLFKRKTSSEIERLTNLSARQVQWLAAKAIEELKRQGKTLEPKKILEEPIEVSHRDGIKVNGSNYKLLYIGEDQGNKKRSLWDLIPDDNKLYQPNITESINTN